MTDWPIAIDQLGTDLEHAIARRKRRRGRLRLPRLLPATALALLVVAAAAIGTSGVIHEGIPVPWSGGEPSSARPLPLEPLRASDPDGGLPWGVRLSRSGAFVCATTGAVMGGRLGVVRERTFHAFPATFHDSCAPVPADGAMVRWAQYPGPNVARRGARTLVYGVAGRRIVQVQVVARNVSRTLALSPRGAFVGAYAGLLSPHELKLRAIRANGTSTVYGGER